MRDLIKHHEGMEERIVKAQRELKKKYPEHELLGLVSVDNGINHCKKLNGRYQESDFYDRLERYITDLENAAKG